MLLATSPPTRRLRRELVLRILDRAAYLAPRDRALLEHVYDRGLSVASLARATGLKPRILQRRLVGLLRRIRHPIFLFLIEKPDLVPDDARPAAELWAFHNLPIRCIARRLGLSLHTVRLSLRDMTTLARLWGYR